jgi:hypothetical protein
MTDQDLHTLLRDHVTSTEPPFTLLPEQAVRRSRAARTRAGIGVAAMGLAAAAVVGVILVTSLPGSGPSGRAEVATSPPASAQAGDDACGVLSCVRPASDTPEDGTLVRELSLGARDDGAEELLYVVRTTGAGTHAGETIDVLKAGYRYDGTVYSTVWALQPFEDGPDAPRFWFNVGPANARAGAGDHLVVLGYVGGSPREITWSTPDGSSGEVDGVLRLDGYTAFYLTLPMPDDYVPPAKVERNDDGSITIHRQNGSTTIPADRVTGKDLAAGQSSSFRPEVTIETSDGWSCTLEDCGSTG